jgi:hypothetical protein
MTISWMQCAAITGLASKEIILGVSPSAKHRSLLSSYLFNLKRGQATVRDMIIADLRSFLELGALHRAADLLVVLRLFFSDRAEAAYAPQLGFVKGTRRKPQLVLKEVNRIMAQTQPAPRPFASCRDSSSISQKNESINAGTPITLRPGGFWV